MAFKLASVSTLALTAALGMTMAACTSMPGWGGAGIEPVIEAPAPVQWVRDVHSHARPEIARVGHVDLDLTADFDRKVLSGKATLDISGREGADQIILDVRNLDIASVTDGVGRALTWRLGANDPILGQALEIDMVPFREGETRKLVISYATRPDAAALQWLSPAQTAGGEQPYLFSQGQAILTRTWIPTQDSPGIRQSYSARIVVPEDLKAVMSAEMITPDGEPAGPGQRASVWPIRCRPI